MYKQKTTFGSQTARFMSTCSQASGSCSQEGLKPRCFRSSELHGSTWATWASEFMDGRSDQTKRPGELLAERMDNLHCSPFGRRQDSPSLMPSSKRPRGAGLLPSSSGPQWLPALADEDPGEHIDEHHAPPANASDWRMVLYHDRNVVLYNPDEKPAFRSRRLSVDEARVRHGLVWLSHFVSSDSVCILDELKHVSDCVSLDCLALHTCWGIVL